MIDEEALDYAARDEISQRWKTYGPKTLNKYASDDIMDAQLLRARRIVSAYLEKSSVPCPCTTLEQDEDCPVGYPSMICGICKGTGNTTPEMVAALASEMIKIASDVGAPEDPFAAWETISLLQSQTSKSV